RRSSTGAAAEQYWSYSIDGVTFIPFDTIYPNAGDPTLETLDFDDITATDNNPNFKLRVEFGNGGPTTGNNRFDNFTLDGKAIVTPALVHYWNFNDNSSLTNLLTSNIDLVGGNSITHIAGPNSLLDLNGTGQNFNINNYNARNGDPSGTHLRSNSPIGGSLEFALPTTGYKDAEVKFATRRSSTGAAAEQYWSYSIDGVTFIPFDTIYPNAGDPTLETLNFDHIAATDNNPNFKLKVEFGVGGPTTGNNRFDNFTLDADPLNVLDVTPPTVIFNPVNNSVNIQINTTITLTFNENIRLINDTPLDNTNAASVVELRLNNSSGALVPFTATFNSNVITITPNSNLLNSQQYYVALLPNTVEDFSDNAITTTQFVQFTTISPQTQFNPGDLLIVAYRMNATSTEDEIAILTLVDIIPGTFINITDAKYTTNSQPQCSGGLVWTSPNNTCVPAGSIIYIQTNAVVCNIGTLSGSGFGLSSSGDQ
ncbi:MAG: Ig-like domain-containing protein, partial [Bacteroidia bacterium]